ncbi:MAG: hypothetical protein ACYCSF_03760 [Acidimicrobiales bacterium]
MSPSSRPPEPPAARSPSLRPALVVVAIAIVIVVGGAVLALAGTGSARSDAPVGPPPAVPGSKLGAESAGRFLSHIASDKEPPSDVINSLAVPAGSRYVDRHLLDRGVGQFDRSVEFSVDATARSVRNFYVRLLSDERWVTNSITEPRAGTSEIIAQRSASDGYQWRVGLIIAGVRTIVAPALAGAAASPVGTTVTMELYQVEDAS